MLPVATTASLLALAACSDSGETSTSSSSSGTGESSSVSSGAGGAQCGNGIVEGTEECDDGNLTSNDGCNNDCSFTCVAGDPTKDHCDDGNACDGAETCGADHVCAPGSPLADGAACDGGKVCVNGNCVLASCGDGLVQSPEECDDGNAASGDGCEPDCSFTCLSTDPNRNCASTDACVTDGTCDDMTHVCAAGVPLMDGTPCGTPGSTCQGGVCTASSCSGVPACTTCATGFCDASGQCVASTCGDGCVDADAGEQCDPPNGTTCDASCHANQVCGDGILSPGEQCDDGNTFNLDGCDSNCKYEVVTRMTSASIQSTAAPAFCTPTTNRLGTQSLTNTALGQINMPLQQGIDDGTTNVLTEFVGLDDLTGVADPMVSIGVLSGSLDPAKGAWPGPPSPIDWWFLADHTTVDPMGLPTGLITNGALAARNLTGGPSDVTLTLLLAGSPAPLKMRSTRIAATLNGTPAPNVPAPPPSQLAPGLTVFQTVTASGNGQGLCGNITVESLSKIPVPETLAMGGNTACGACNGSHTYTYCGANMPVGPNCNSLLDVLVGGCKVVLCFVTAVNPQQPDVPTMMGGTVQPLSLGTGNKVPSAQTNGNNDAYSAYLKFDANRAHFTGESCTATSDCQLGKTCNAGTCQ